MLFVPILLILAMAVLLGLVIRWMILQERKRREEFVAWATQAGFQLPHERWSPPARYELFQRGHSRSSRYRATKSIAGPPGLSEAPLELFEYHYARTTGSGKQRRTQHYHFVCAIVAPACDLGWVEVSRESIGDKFFQAVGFDDIDFEDPEFSRSYKVHAKDRRQAYDLFDGAMMRYFCATSRPDLVTTGRELLAFFSGQASPTNYQAMHDFIAGFLQQIPRTLVNAERSHQGLEPLLEAGNAAGTSKAELDRLERTIPR